VNIPSFQCKAGDVVAIREKSQKQLRIAAALAIASQVGFPEWVEVDDKKMTGVFKQMPAREEILPDINENLVVELYSK
jgi:small subunit ribosomal protein S4